MALATRSNTQSLLAGTKYGNRENSDAIVGKAQQGKAKLTNASARTALGNRTNVLPTNVESKKVAGKDNEAPLKPRLAKSAATTSLQTVAEKENPVRAARGKAAQPKPVEKTPVTDALSPMDVGSGAFSRQMLPPNVADIDSEDKENPQLVSEYVNDIYEYMRHLESRYAIAERYLDGRDINGRMRGILVDWLVQVHLRFHLLQETLYLTIAIIDRFLEHQEVSRSKLQLVGVTAMLVASKYEEMYAPEIADFVYITDNAYTKSDIRKMECIILKTLDFQLGRPLPLHFLRRNSKAGDVDAAKHTLAKYLMELTVVDYEMAHLPPSRIAAASLCLSMKLLDGSTWSETLSHYSRYTEDALMPIIKRIALLVSKAGTGKLTAIHTKYQSSKFMRTSKLPELQSKTITELAAQVAR